MVPPRVMSASPPLPHDVVGPGPLIISEDRSSVFERGSPQGAIGGDTMGSPFLGDLRFNPIESGRTSGVGRDVKMAHLGKQYFRH